jgi:hypothetical protein
MSYPPQAGTRVHTHESDPQGGILPDAALPGLATHAPLITGVHGAGSDYLALADQAALIASKVIWKNNSEQALYDTARTANSGWNDLDLTSYTSAKAKFAILLMRIQATVIGSGNSCTVTVRWKGTTTGEYPSFSIDKAGVTLGVAGRATVVVGCTVGQVIEWFITVTTGWTVYTWIDVLGYIE